MPDVSSLYGAVADRLPGPIGTYARPPRAVRGRVVVVTGGASGIGLATARELAERGGLVAIGDVDGAAAADAAVGAGARMGRYLDVSDTRGFTAFLDDVERELGPIDVLVNNAGIMPLGLLVEEPDVVTERVLQVNLHGVIHGTREAMQRMVPRGRGHIVNVASTLGKAGLPGGASYCATKFAIVGLCEAVHAELLGSGVHVTIVMPGVVETALGEGVGPSLGIRRVRPNQVAGAIAGVLERPRYEVYVPREAGPVALLGAVLPQGVRDQVGRAMGLHSALADADREARESYEARVRSID